MYKIQLLFRNKNFIRRKKQKIKKYVNVNGSEVRTANHIVLINGTVSDCHMQAGKMFLYTCEPILTTDSGEMQYI